MKINKNKYEILAFLKSGKPTIKSINLRVTNLVISLDFSWNTIENLFSIGIRII